MLYYFHNYLFNILYYVYGQDKNNSIKKINNFLYKNNNNHNIFNNQRQT